MGKFRYMGGERTSEDVTRMSRRPTGGFDRYVQDGIAWFKPKEGENCIRIIPLTPEDFKIERGWDVQIHLHQNVGPDQTAYLCLAKNPNLHEVESCPVCDAKKTTDEERKQLRVGWRSLVFLIDRNAEKIGPQIWSMPPTVYNEMMSRNQDKKTNATIKIDDPEEGYDFFFNREGTGLRTDYTQMEFDRESSPLSSNQKLQERWLDYITENQLSQTLRFYDAEHIQNVLYGEGVRRDDDGSDDADAPAPRGASRRPAPEETEGEDPPPRRRGAAPAEGDEEVPFDETETSRSGRRAPPPEDSEPEEAAPPRSGRRAQPAADEGNGENPPSRAGRRTADSQTERRRVQVPQEDDPKLARAATSGRERLNRLERNVRR